MEKLICALLEYTDTSDSQSLHDATQDLDMIFDTNCGIPLSKLSALIAASQSLTRSLVTFDLSKKNPDSSDVFEPSLESAIMDITMSIGFDSEAKIDFAIDELLKRKELFSKELLCVSDVNLEEVVASAIADPVSPSPSNVYKPKAPRLPGNPDPLPDEFGDWDEYRDDMDPGYRVREVFESDLAAECMITRSRGDSSVVSHDPSPILAPVCLTDELDLARVDSERGSPVFGSIDSTTLQFNYMGDSFDVERRSQNVLNVPTIGPPPTIPSIWPLTGADGVTIDALMLPVVYERGRTGFQPSKEFDASNGTLVAGRYRILGYLGSAAFSKAMRAVDILTEKEVCLKIIKNEKDYVDQSLDEIKMLLLLKGGSNILNVENFFYFKEHLIIVTELLCDNLYEYSRFHKHQNWFTIGRVQRIAHQLLTALVHVHSQGVIHCDLKPENILFKSYSRCEVKLIDFGSACFQSDKLSTYIQSRSYRAPEVVLGCLPYSAQVDMWSLGCVLAELWTGYVLFQNDSCQSLLARILGIIGPIPKHMIQSGANVDQLFINQQSLFIEMGQDEASGGRLCQLLVPKKTSLFQRMRIQDPEFLDFLAQLLQIDPDLRLSAKDALEHPWMVTSKYSDGI